MSFCSDLTSGSFSSQWIGTVYKFHTFFSKGQDSVHKGLKWAGVSGILNASTILPPEDHFHLHKTIIHLTLLITEFDHCNN